MPETEEAVFAADAIPDFGALYPRQVSIHQWRVLHLSDTGENKVYEIDLRDPECSCPDYKYRKGESPGVCKHMAAAIFEARKNMDVGEALTFDTLELGREVRSLAEDLQRRVTGIEADRVAAPSTGSKPQGTQGNSGGSQGPDAEEAREKLQEAFDGITAGMKTMVADGKIWINKSPEAPDWTFSAWLQEPEQVFYEPDDAPEDYFKNSILPQNVEEYISEVLE